MSTLPESRQQAALRVQAEQLSKLISPTLESKLKEMVDKVKMDLMLEMEAEIKRVVKEQVDAYCKRAFDVDQEDHFHMIREQSDERPNTPSIEEDRYVRKLSDPPVLSRESTEFNHHMKLMEESADHAWYWLGGKKVSDKELLPEQ